MGSIWDDSVNEQENKKFQCKGVGEKFFLVFCY